MNKSDKSTDKRIKSAIRKLISCYCRGRGGNFFYFFYNIQLERYIPENNISFIILSLSKIKKFFFSLSPLLGVF